MNAPTHTYVEEGTYTETVTVTHDALPSVTSAGQSIVVADQQITNLTVVESTLPTDAMENVQNAAITGVATFTDPAGLGDETPADFVATIDPGDGQPALTGTVVFVNSTAAGANYSINSPAFTYVEEASYPFSVTVTHDALPPVTATSSSTINVAEAGLPFTDDFTGTSGSPLNSSNYAVQLGSFTQDGDGHAVGGQSVNFATYTGTSTSDVSISAAISNLGASANGLDAGLVARYTGTGANDASYYFGTLVATSSGSVTAQIWLWVNGTGTMLSSSGPLSGLGSTNTLTFNVEGTSLSLSVNGGTPVTTATDTTLTYEGLIGFAVNQGVQLGAFNATELFPTFPFSSNFSGPAGALGSNFVEVPAGSFTQNGSGIVTGNMAANMALYGGASFGDVDVSATVGALPPSSMAGLLARFSDPVGVQSFYFGTLITDAKGDLGAQIFRTINGVATPLFTTPVPVTGVSGSVNLKFTVVGGTLQLFVNGNLIASVTDFQITSEGLTGFAGNLNTTFTNFSAKADVGVLPFTDSFSGTGVPLNANNWQVAAGSFTQNGGNVSASGTTNIALYLGEATDDVNVSTTILNLPAQQSAGLVARWSADGSNFNAYEALLVNNNGEFSVQLLRVQDRNATALASVAVTGVASSAAMKFDLVGDNLQVFINGTMIINVFDTGLTDQGLVGIAGNSNTTFGPFSVSRPS